MPNWMLHVAAWAITVTGLCGVVYLCFILSAYCIDKALKAAGIQWEIIEAVFQRRAQKREANEVKEEADHA